MDDWYLFAIGLSTGVTSALAPWVVAAFTPWGRKATQYLERSICVEYQRQTMQAAIKVLVTLLLDVVWIWLAGSTGTWWVRDGAILGLAFQLAFGVGFGAAYASRLVKDFLGIP